ncbi:MAG TPA: amidohydrolase family protein, partial [Planctomycetota bacterium]|nr:amidohydrolase family protein [Planctomycetota bacterium]
ARAPVGDDLAEQMRAAVAFGAPPEVALRAVTRGAAEILGVADRTGTLEAGRDADLVLWSADPAERVAAPLAVFVDGRLVHRRETP